MGRWPPRHDCANRLLNLLQPSASKKMNRRLFILASVLPISGLSGCMLTEALHSKASRKDYNYYSETVSQILATDDGKKIVVIGREHHYILDAPPRLVELLDSPLHVSLSARMDRFDVNPDADLKGNVTLILKDGASDDNLRLAQGFGFSRNGKSMDLSMELSGKRYSAGTFSMPASQARALNRPYEVRIREEQPGAGRAALVLLTPLTVAADGVLLLLTIPLVPFALPLVVALATR